MVHCIGSMVITISLKTKVVADTKRSVHTKVFNHSRKIDFYSNLRIVTEERSISSHIPLVDRAGIDRSGRLGIKRVPVAISVTNITKAQMTW